MYSIIGVYFKVVTMAIVIIIAFTFTNEWLCQLFNILGHFASYNLNVCEHYNNKKDTLWVLVIFVLSTYQHTISVCTFTVLSLICPCAPYHPHPTTPATTSLSTQSSSLSRWIGMIWAVRRWRSQTLAWPGNGTKPQRWVLRGPTPGWLQRSSKSLCFPRAVMCGGTALFTVWPLKCVCFWMNSAGLA